MNSSLISLAVAVSLPIFIVPLSKPKHQWISSLKKCFYPNFSLIFWPFCSSQFSAPSCVGRPQRNHRTDPRASDGPMDRGWPSDGQQICAIWRLRRIVRWAWGRCVGTLSHGILQRLVPSERTFQSATVLNGSLIGWLADDQMDRYWSIVWSVFQICLLCTIPLLLHQ